MFKKNALISVYDKRGIEVFAQGLVDLGWKIISSGGTAKYLEIHRIPVTYVEEITGMPSILGHRVVTLHPKIHGALLGTDDMIPQMEQYGIPWIDLVCVGLYPLREEVQNTNATAASLIEKTDIGGPALIRSAVKGGRIVAYDAEAWREILHALRTGTPIDRNAYAQNAEASVLAYCWWSATAREMIARSSEER